LGSSLARLQRMLSVSTAAAAAAAAPPQAPAAAEEDGTNAQQQQGAAVSSRDVALAVAACMLQPVVLELEVRVKAAAAAAVAAPDDPRFRRVSVLLCTQTHLVVLPISHRCEPFRPAAGTSATSTSA
jgi:hypothetical protein